MIEIGPNLTEAIKAIAFAAGIIGLFWGLAKLFNGD